MTKKAYRLHPNIRIVQDDRLCHPVVERELRAMELARKVAALAVGISVLGLSFLVVLALSTAARWWR